MAAVLAPQGSGPGCLGSTVPEWQWRDLGSVSLTVGGLHTFPEDRHGVT